MKIVILVGILFVQALAIAFLRSVEVLRVRTSYIEEKVKQQAKYYPVRVISWTMPHLQNGVDSESRVRLSRTDQMAFGC